MASPHMTADALKVYALKIDAKTGRLIGYTEKNDGGGYHAQRIDDARRPEPPPAPAPRYQERHHGNGDPGARVHAAVVARCRALGVDVHARYASVLREVLHDDPALAEAYVFGAPEGVRERA